MDMQYSLVVVFPLAPKSLPLCNYGLFIFITKVEDWDQWVWALCSVLNTDHAKARPFACGRVSLRLLSPLLSTGHPFLQVCVCVCIYSAHNVLKLFDLQLENIYTWLCTCRDVGDMIESDVDVVLLSTSIVSVAGVVRSIPFERLGRRPPPLFVDVLSVKEYPRDLLLQVSFCFFGNHT